MLKWSYTLVLPHWVLAGEPPKTHGPFPLLGPVQLETIRAGVEARRGLELRSNIGRRRCAFPPLIPPLISSIQARSKQTQGSGKEKARETRGLVKHPQRVRKGWMVYGTEDAS